MAPNEGPPASQELCVAPYQPDMRLSPDQDPTKSFDYHYELQDAYLPETTGSPALGKIGCRKGETDDTGLMSIMGCFGG